jgi:hypothetical protein
MPNYCQRTRSYANLYRLQFCQARDEHTVYDPADACSRCKRCGERAIQCSVCLTLAHWGESPCPHCGTDIGHRWDRANTASSPGEARPATPGNGHSSRGTSKVSSNPAPAPAPVHSLEDAIIEFFGLLPFEAAKGAYRLAIKELHPDKGGDPVKAARLNATWQRIESEIFKR